MLITVTEPRAIIIGKHILLPGRNELSEEMADTIQRQPGTKRALEKFARSGLIKFDGSGPKLDASDSLEGLDDARALHLVESTEDEAQLERWLRKTKPKSKLREAVQMQLELVKSDKKAK
jgi:hypothetical protein